MGKVLKSAISGLITCLLAATGTSSAAAATAGAPSWPDASTLIVGGERADRTSWAVQLHFVARGERHGCTGVAISESWVLTAGHCVSGISAMSVYYSNSTLDRGKPTTADQVAGSPAGDVGLVHLSSPHKLRSYPDLSAGYHPGAADSGTIMGYGLRADQRPAKRLYEADVSVTHASTDAYGGPAIHVRGINGASNHGDSGGPLIVDGEIVGVCSTGDEADPGSNIHAGSNYANLTSSRGWIQSITGI
ncbi:MAG: secretion protein [Arthrobacter sp.]|nr:secretion protein [Arthrobacter sp.]MCU1547835.1 secretion protein [Arthrobacter sp.]